MSSAADSLIKDMTAKLVGTMHNTAIIPHGKRGVWRTTVYLEKEGVKKRKVIYAPTKDTLYE